MFGERLKSARMKSGITQKEAAKIFNITERAYQNYEMNKSTPNVALLLTIANYFNISIDYLLGREVSLENTVQSLTPEEKLLLTAFRKNSDMKSAVFRLLGISNPDEILVYRAARSIDHREPTIERMTSADIEKLRNAHPVINEEDL